MQRQQSSPRRGRSPPPGRLLILILFLFLFPLNSLKQRNAPWPAHPHPHHHPIPITIRILLLLLGPAPRHADPQTICFCISLKGTRTSDHDMATAPIRVRKKSEKNWLSTSLSLRSGPLACLWLCNSSQGFDFRKSILFWPNIRTTSELGQLKYTKSWPPWQSLAQVDLPRSVSLSL